MKKFFAVAMITVMALSTVIVANAESLTGVAWWTGMQTGTDYKLSGDGIIALDVTFHSTEDEAGYGAFNVEIYEPSAAQGAQHYITTGSDQNAWYAEKATGDAITGIATEFSSTIQAGNTYRVTVTHLGADITITYYNPDGSKYAEYVAANTNLGSDIAVHVIAQVGTYTVSLVDKVFGDVNGDGKLTLTDSALIRRYLANWDVTFNLELADVDANGKVELVDSALIRRYLAGWNVTIRTE